MGAWQIIAGLLILGIMVTVHELGHFGMGKWLRVAVEDFSIGMGPAIYRRKFRETEFCLRLLPIGGMCRFLGEDEEAPDPRAFNNQPKWKRALIIVAGPVMNVLFALCIGVLLLSAIGAYQTVNRVYEVEPAMPAYTAGMENGDVIVGINGQATDSYNEVSRLMKLDAESQVTVTVERDGVVQDVVMQPVWDEATNKYRIGIVFDQERVKMGFFGAIAQSFRMNGEMLKEMATALGRLVTRGEGVQDMAGPVGIIDMVGKATQQGMDMVLLMMMMISLNLGLVNMLPFPALDGGRLVFLLIELIRGKPFDRNKEGLVNLIGLGLLFTVMIFFTWQDIARKISGS